MKKLTFEEIGGLTFYFIMIIGVIFCLIESIFNFFKEDMGFRLLLFMIGILTSPIIIMAIEAVKSLKRKP